MLKKITFLFASVLAIATSTQALAQGDLLERINSKGTITVGTGGTYAPFTYHDANGKLTGYDVEVTRAVAKKLGVTVEFKETQWDAMLAGLKAGRFDLVANQVALTTPERQATFDKSEPYSWSGAMLIARNDETRINQVEDVKGLKAAQTLSSNYGELAQKYQAKIVPIDGMAQGLLLIQQKRADITFNDALALLDYLKKHPNSGLKPVWKAENKAGAGLIVNKNNEEALAKISAAIEELRNDGTLKQLGEQFFGRDISVK
ncbi:amino acid ABC transporter substrate-binding protein [Canicola haemoglobinophilus]|uniref:Amino acid ABC transporter substrate-binding n=1 Tax=Canicola haemoglobinophilus TaxID=733 RepID=A0A1V4B2N1_9PAST|nr:amino acid ABC transporter substrate-binding protein [Canicola haemoglobinophilus]OOS01521.1 amino acid ABC transporter substrate-binding protein [Canicola haemoglobinophilus]STO59980.1 amino acid ABC transporter substrate-binding [Canicola haemoglobinophilus]